jgi:hypothetical protein
MRRPPALLLQYYTRSVDENIKSGITLSYLLLYQTFNNDRLENTRNPRAAQVRVPPLSCDGNPLVDERTGARHADVRLGGLWNKHGLKKGKRGLWPRWFYSKLNRTKPNKTDRKTTALHVESPPKENPCTLPTARQRSRKITRSRRRRGALRGSWQQRS